MNKQIKPLKEPQNLFCVMILSISFFFTGNLNSSQTIDPIQKVQYNLVDQMPDISVTTDSEKIRAF